MATTHRFRAGLLATAAGAGLVAFSGAASAAEFSVGDVKVTLDTTISLGASMRLDDRDSRFLPEANGGPRDPRTSGVILPIPVAPTTLIGLPGSTVTLTGNPDNYDGSINTDDGRLNFDNGDWIGATAKVSHDFLVEYDNFTLFTRFYYFYDNILSDGEVGRSGLGEDARSRIGSSVELLDLYVSGNFNLGELPLNIRVGNQVVSWGEGTFILNGINVVNPIDVGAFRRPGAEIKEGLLPVPLVYASLGLPANISLEAFYQFGYEPYKIDPAGSPFSNADIVFGFNDNGLGNLNGVSYTSGSLFSGTRRNCAGGADGPGPGISGGVAAGLLPAPTCLFGSQTDYRTPLTLGLAERDKNARGDVDVVYRGVDHQPDTEGQFGMALRWYSEELGATEFSLYYVNYHSRLPFQEITGGQPSLGISTTAASANVRPGAAPADALAGRFAPAVGCVNPAFGPGASPSVFIDPRFAAFQNQAINDPMNLINPQAAAVTNAIFQAAGGTAFFADPANPSKTYGSAMAINCALALAQSSLVDLDGNGVFGGGADLPMLVNGSEVLSINYDSQLDIIYPEDIQMFGFSFNTTIGGWGVQGEISYRPEVPFQTDTDAQTIQSAAAQCAIPVQVADLGFSAFEGRNVGGVANCNPGAVNHLDGVGRFRTQSLIYNEMYTVQLGTTATFTQSDPIVEFLGADLGVLVTEFGAVYVPGVEDTYLTNADGTATGINMATAQYQNLGCQGSDLPLGALLGLDFKPSEDCRPSDFSFGYVLLARVDYNNAFGSGWVVSPQVAFSHDVMGATPAPYGNFLEDRMSVNVSVSGTLDNAWRVGMSYTNFFGGGIRNKASDQDFGSLTFSYSF